MVVQVRSPRLFGEWESSCCKSQGERSIFTQISAIPRINSFFGTSEMCNVPGGVASPPNILVIFWDVGNLSHCHTCSQTQSRWRSSLRNIPSSAQSQILRPRSSSKVTYKGAIFHSFVLYPARVWSIVEAGIDEIHSLGDGSLRTSNPAMITHIHAKESNSQALRIGWMRAFHRSWRQWRAFAIRIMKSKY